MTDAARKKRMGLELEGLLSRFDADEDAAIALIAAGALLDEKGIAGGTALTWAAYWGHTRAAAALIAAGATIDLPDSTGRTPLGHACERRRGALARLLLAKGADPAHLDAHNKTPLDYAQRHCPELLPAMREAQVTLWRQRGMPVVSRKTPQRPRFPGGFSAN